MKKYLSSSVIVVIALYVVFAGLLIVASVFEWASWTNIQDWLGKGAVVAVVFLLVNTVVALLTTVLPHSNSSGGRKK